MSVSTPTLFILKPGFLKLKELLSGSLQGPGGGVGRSLLGVDPPMVTFPGSFRVFSALGWTRVRSLTGSPAGGKGKMPAATCVPPPPPFA